MSKFTPGPWFVRTLERMGEVQDCFVAAKDVLGFAYDAEIMGDDEYRDGIERKMADARLIAAAPDLLEELAAARETIQQFQNSMTGPFFQEQIDRMDAAIKKATS